MKKFSEMGITTQDEKNMFPVPIISIQEVTNCEIEILDFQSAVKTKYGDGRCVVKIRFENIERKFFTNASKIKEVLDKVPKEDFPFLATIKAQRYGTESAKTFQFT